MTTETERQFAGELPPENELDNREYKKILTNMTNHKSNKYASQLKSRLINGSGIAYYFIGVEDDGRIVGIPTEIVNEQLSYVYQICKKINASIQKIEWKKDETGENRYGIITIKADFELEELPFIF